MSGFGHTTRDTASGPREGENVAEGIDHLQVDDDRDLRPVDEAPQTLGEDIKSALQDRDPDTESSSPQV